jgi:thiamine-phosphate pyrophosphorylase
MAESPDCQLYLITPPRLDPAAFAGVLSAALDAGVVAAVQLRLKAADDGEVMRAAAVIRPLCHDRDVAFILNDRPDLALAAGADGVHIGQSDASYEEARRTLGPDAIVGVTCHQSRDLALEAAEVGADYVAFGAFFPTATKAATTRADPEILRWWSDFVTVPAVAIGGITVANCAPLVAAGADFLAVVAGVWDYQGGPAAAVGDLNAEIARTGGIGAPNLKVL